MSVAEQLQRLEADVTHLKTWAGPGQVEALLDGQRELREDMGKVKAKLDRHERILGTLKKDVGGLKKDVGGLKKDVGGLKEDVGGLKAEFAEFKADMSDFKAEMLDFKAVVLRRLPAAPSVS
jgi:archaellum component FlaC